MTLKSLFFVAAALSLAGCSQNEVVEKNPDANPAIRFGVYTGVQTRGTETTSTTLKASDADGFGFLAYKTSTEGWGTDGSTATPSFLYNEHGKWNTAGGSGSGGWEYANTRFWPTNTDKISFFGYAPYEAAPALGTNKGIKLSGNDVAGAPTIEFTVKNTTGTIDWNGMVDLVTDCRDDVKDMTSTSGTPAGTVKFKFSHVLTKVADVKVKAQTNLGDNTRIFVTGLKLDPGTSKLYDKATYKFGDDTWEALAAPSYFTGDKDLTGFLNKTNADFNGYTESSVKVEGITAVSLFHADADHPAKALYFIPVGNITGTGAEGDLNLKISYDLVTKDATGTGHVKSTVADKVIKLPAGTFKKGTAHTYTLTINMNAISIDVDDTLTPWADSAEEGVNP